MQLSRWLPVVVLVLVGIGVICGCGKSGLPPQSEWTKVTSDDGRMSALFPRPPKTQSETVDSKIGKLTIKMTIYEAGNDAFLINHMPIRLTRRSMTLMRSSPELLKGLLKMSKAPSSKMMILRPLGFLVSHC